jgi:tetratricopeptide (TPR) repeat protein
MKLIGKKSIKSFLMGFNIVFIGLILISTLAACGLSSGQQAAIPTVMATAHGGVVPTVNPIPSPTFIQLWTRTPEVQPSPTPTGSSKPTDSPAKKNQKLAFVQTQAVDLMAKQRYQEAITYWDQVIKLAPDNAEAYYQRASAYQSMTATLRDLSVFEDYLTRAKEDVDKAITLAPLTNSDYYVLRGRVLDDFANELIIYRVNRQPLYESAIENYKVALTMGTSKRNLERTIPVEFVDLGRCKEGLTETNRLVEIRDPALPESYQLDALLSSQYLCLEKYEKALEYLDKASKLSPDVSYDLQKANILCAMGREDEAFDIVNQSINASPMFNGYRYYLRALIHYDRGEKDLAAKDLKAGSINTWDHTGLYAYLTAKLTLDAGHRAEGLKLLQYAEATIHPDFEPAIYKRILKDMAAQDIKPVTELPEEYDMVLTAIPARFWGQITPQFIMTATSSLQDYQLKTPKSQDSKATPYPPNTGTEFGNPFDDVP